MRLNSFGYHHIEFHFTRMILHLEMSIQFDSIGTFGTDNSFGLLRNHFWQFNPYNPDYFAAGLHIYIVECNIAVQSFVGFSKFSLNIFHFQGF